MINWKIIPNKTFFVDGKTVFYKINETNAETKSSTKKSGGLSIETHKTNGRVIGYSMTIDEGELISGKSFAGIFTSKVSDKKFKMLHQNAFLKIYKNKKNFFILERK